MRTSLMPDGYETGGRAGTSPVRRTEAEGGHRQSHPAKSPIIILDEATASVDVETERQIQNAISRIAGTRTILAIAHRLSTIRNADLILVIEDGRVAERGTHEELMAKKGYYYQMQLAQSEGQTAG